MVQRLGSIALAVQAVVLAVLLLAPEVHALWQEGLVGIGGWGVEAVQFPLSHSGTVPPAPGAPVIVSFTPTNGEPGTQVQINGSNFDGVTSVTFGGVPSESFFFLSSGGFATVPFGAVTGPISVTNSFGTGVSHDNFNVAPFVIGARNLRVSFGVYPTEDTIHVSWQGGTAGQEYYALWFDLTHGVSPVPIGPFPGLYFNDDVAPAGSLVCYVVTPIGGGAVLGWSDMECALRGIRDGAVAPATLSLSLSQSNTATLSWPASWDTGYVVGRLPLDGSPVSTVVPARGYHSDDTGGVATCYLVAGVKLGPPLEFGTSNLLCGFPGITTLGSGAAAVTKERLVQNVQQAMATVRVREVTEAVRGAAESLAGPTE